MTHTEHVHLLFGIGLTLAGALWLGAQAYPADPLRYVWPLLLVAVGVFLVIRVFPNSLSVWLAAWAAHAADKRQLAAGAHFVRQQRHPPKRGQHDRI